jgi:hypothetical protein
MPGHRRAPTKSADNRARRNKDTIPHTEVEFVKATQPALPKRMPDGAAWPPRTRAWWRRWGRDPRARRFDAAAWDDLLDTAIIHARLWSGDWKAASELRLRIAKYGVTPEDRARMRVTLADGLEDVTAPPATPSSSTPSAHERYAGLRVVNGSPEPS